MKIQNRIHSKLTQTVIAYQEWRMKSVEITDAIPLKANTDSKWLK
ncbi:MAG: hypothetical protein U5J96_15805 [Ignavibacteriaceae bacterium]|nr:hypothetical protein [Ignavibacteriaceae bacterium]